MSRTITIDPVTRVEGHAKITIQLDDAGNVADAFLHVTQIRGFEKFIEGRPFTEMPAITARICGICPVSHLLASAKACDALLAVKIPETGANLRKLMNFAQYVQSHALSFFHLTSPDLLIGMDGDPAIRNVLGVAGQYPELATYGIKLRQFGQQVIEMLGAKRVHPAWIVPGGVNAPLSEENREKILAMIPDAMKMILASMDWYKGAFEAYREEIRTFGNFPTMFMGLVTKSDHPDQNALLEHYDGVLRFTDSVGNVVADQVDPTRYFDYIGEAVEPYSYLKMPYFKSLGYPEGIYRVGPLARLNVIDRAGTPKADQEWAEYRALRRGAILSSFHYHYARLVEILYSIERMEQLLSNPNILDTHVRAHAEPNAYEGVGVIEAPRGTLIHHYKIDDNGLMTWANLIVASGNNNLAMNQAVKQVAKHYVKGNELTEGMLNRVEAVVRCYDPCFSCSTHAVGQMPMQVTLVGPDGEVLNQARRG